MYSETALGSVDFTYSDGGGDFQLPPPGVYKIVYKGAVMRDGKLVTFERQKTVYNSKELLYDDDGAPVMDIGYQHQFAIDDDEDDFDGVEFRDIFPGSITTGNKSGWLWAAFLDKSVEDVVDDVREGRMTSSNVAIGRRCEATLEHSVSKGNGKTYIKIKAAAPLRKKKGARERPVVEGVEPSEAPF
jgi:hypothetical protein